MKIKIQDKGLAKLMANLESREKNMQSMTTKVVTKYTGQLKAEDVSSMMGVFSCLPDELRELIESYESAITALGTRVTTAEQAVSLIQTQISNIENNLSSLLKKD